VTKYWDNTPDDYPKRKNTTIYADVAKLNECLRMGYSPAEAFAIGIRLCVDKGPHVGARYGLKGRDPKQLRQIAVWDDEAKMDEAQNLGYTFIEALNAGFNHIIINQVPKRAIVQERARFLLDEINKNKKEMRT
jgi:hypothetical protein